MLFLLRREQNPVKVNSSVAKISFKLKRGGQYDEGEARNGE